MRFVWAAVTFLVGLVMLPIAWNFIAEMDQDMISSLPGLTVAEAAFPALLALSFFVLIIIAFIMALRGRN